MSETSEYYTTATEENYLKAILKASAIMDPPISTTTLAESLHTTPASVTDMVRKLKEKGLVLYEKYRGVSLTEPGRLRALQILRRHRLWEAFLVKALHFTWEEVHETAEQLEHIRSSKLIEKIDEYLGFPQFDPHGDPIPNADGVLPLRDLTPLTEIQRGARVKMAAVQTHASDFLMYLNRLRLGIDSEIYLVDVIPFDGSRVIQVEGQEAIISQAVAQNILVYRSAAVKSEKTEE